MYLGTKEKAFQAPILLPPSLHHDGVSRDFHTVETSSLLEERTNYLVASEPEDMSTRNMETNGVNNKVVFDCVYLS